MSAFTYEEVNGEYRIRDWTLAGAVMAKTYSLEAAKKIVAALNEAMEKEAVRA